jgi:hypothetical protein
MDNAEKTQNLNKEPYQRTSVGATGGIGASGARGFRV